MNCKSLNAIIYPGSPGGSVVENPPDNAGDVGLIPGSRKSPGEGNGNPFQYSCLGEFYGQRGLVGYSPWGREESDTTKQLTHTHTHTHTHTKQRETHKFRS